MLDSTGSTNVKESVYLYDLDHSRALSPARHLPRPNFVSLSQAHRLRTCNVCLAGLAMLLPFIQDIVGLVGALELYPLTVFLPIQMHIKQAGVLPWTSKWVPLQLLSMLCLTATAAGCIGSVVSLLQDVKGYKAFQNTTYYSS